MGILPGGEQLGFVACQRETGKKSERTKFRGLETIPTPTKRGPRLTLRNYRVVSLMGKKCPKDFERLTLCDGFLEDVMFGLELGDQVAPLQVLSEFLEEQKTDGAWVSLHLRPGRQRMVSNSGLTVK